MFGVLFEVSLGTNQTLYVLGVWGILLGDEILGAIAWHIDALVLKPAIYIEPSPNVKTEKWSNLFVALIGVPVVSEAPNLA